MLWQVGFPGPNFLWCDWKALYRLLQQREEGLLSLFDFLRILFFSIFVHPEYQWNRNWHGPWWTIMDHGPHSELWRWHWIYLQRQHFAHSCGLRSLWAPSGWSKAPAQKKGSEGSGSTTCGRSRALRAQTCSKNWKHLIEALFLHIWTCSELNLIPFHIGLQPLLQCRKRSPGLWRPEGDEHVSKILIWKMLRSISICFYFNAKYTETFRKLEPWASGARRVCLRAGLLATQELNETHSYRKLGSVYIQCNLDIKK